MSRAKNTQGQPESVVDLLDRMIELYGPIFTDLLDANPEANGIRGFIDRADPVALLKDDEGRGYGDDEFDDIASASLRPIAGAMLDMMASTPLSNRHGCGFHFDIDRDAEGSVSVTAMVTTKGAAFVRRTATVFRNNGIGFVAKPAEVAILAFSEDPTLVVDAIQAAQKGFDAAAALMRKTGTLHIFSASDDRAVRALVDGAYAGPTARVSRMGRNGAWIIASSTHQPYKIFASDAAFDELKSKVPDDVVFKVLPDVASGPAFLN